MHEVSMMERRFISARIDLAMLNFSFDFHTVLWAIDKQKFLMLVCLDRRKSVRCLYFSLEKTKFELNFSAIEMSRCSAMHVCVSPLRG